MPQKSPNQLFRKLFYRYTVLIVCIVTALVIYFISETRSGILETNLNYMNMMAEKASGYLEESAQAVQYIQTDLYQSPDIMEDFLAYFRLEDEEYQKYRLDSYMVSSAAGYKGFDTFVQNAMEAYPDIISIEVISYTKSRITLCYPDGITYIRQGAEKRVTQAETDRLAGDGTFSFVREIRDLNTLTGEGCMIINFAADEFAEIRDYYDTAEMMVYNQREQMIYQSDEAINSKEFFEAEAAGAAESYLNSYIQNTEVTGYSVFAFLNRQKAAHMPWSLFLTIAGIGLALIFLGEWCVKTHLQRLTDRMNKIIDGMHEITTGNLEVRLDADRNGDELDVISQHFNEMCQELDQYIQKSYLAEIEQKNAEIEVLQNQINPHFLYNTLEAIRMKAICNGDREVGKMLYAMAVIFRSQLKDDAMISLIQEIHYCKKYLELFEYRYQGIFTSSVCCPEELMDFHVMKFILQPILENYFVHGIRGEQEGNRVDIRVEKQEDALMIYVEDNGRGMDSQALEEKNRELRNPGRTDKKSIGITNVNRRIQAVYGPMYGLTLSQREGGGLCVAVKIGIVGGETDEKSNAD